MEYVGRHSRLKRACTMSAVIVNRLLLLRPSNAGLSARSKCGLLFPERLLRTPECRGNAMSDESDEGRNSARSAIERSGDEVRNLPISVLTRAVFLGASVGGTLLAGPGLLVGGRYGALWGLVYGAGWGLANGFVAAASMIACRRWIRAKHCARAGIVAGLSSVPLSLAVSSFWRVSVPACPLVTVTALVAGLCGPVAFFGSRMTAPSYSSVRTS